MPNHTRSVGERRRQSGSLSYTGRNSRWLSFASREIVAVTALPHTLIGAIKSASPIWRKFMILRSLVLALFASTSLQATAAELPHTTSQPEKATSFLTISPIFSQLVAFKMPLAFHVVNEETSAHAYIREAVPSGETVEQWTQMITVTGYKGVAADPGPPPAVLINSIAGGFKKACPDTISIGDLGEAPIDGRPAALAFVACGSVGDAGQSHSESAVIMVVKGSQDYYSIQWAERGPAQTATVDFDKQKWVGRLQQLMPVFVCTKVPGEEAPYPSCTSRLPSSD